MFQLNETVGELELLAKKLGLNSIPYNLTDEFGTLNKENRSLPLEQKGTYNGQEWTVKEFLSFMGFDTESIHYRDNGRTRVVYEANNTQLNEDEEIKITFPPLGLESVATQINLKNSGVNENELSNNENSRHQTNTRARFVFDNETEITIEKKLDGKSLEELVHQNKMAEGSWSIKQGFYPSEIKDILKDVVDITHYYNIRKETLLRDITAGNFMYDGKSATLIDRQNAIKERDVGSESLPTRGGTPYTHPHLLMSQYNRVEVDSKTLKFNDKRLDKVSKLHTNPDKRTEVYSLGALTYYLITGKHAFNYKLEFATEEEILSGKTRTIEVKGINGIKQREVVLKDGNEIIEEINMVRHNKKLKHLVKDLPDSYQRLVYKSLTADPNKEFEDVRDFETELRTKDVPLLKQIAEKAYNGIKGAAITAGVGLFLVSTVFLDRCTREPMEPTLNQINQMNILKEFRHFNAPKQEIDSMYKIMEQAVLKKQDRVLNIISEGEFGKEWNENSSDYNLEWLIDRRPDIRTKTSMKLRKAISFSCLLSDSKELREFYKDKRTKNFLIPYKWIENVSYQNRNIIKEDIDEMFAYEEIHVARYVANRTEVDKPVEETIARYFLDTEEIDKAKIATGATHYFEKYNPSTKTFTPGYRNAIPETIRETIDLTTAMYHLSNEKGEYNCEVINETIKHINKGTKEVPEFLNVKNDLFQTVNNFNSQQEPK